MLYDMYCTKLFTFTRESIQNSNILIEIIRCGDTRHMRRVPHQLLTRVIEGIDRDVDSVVSRSDPNVLVSLNFHSENSACWLHATVSST